MRQIGILVRATRPHFLTITLVAVGLGWSCAWWGGIPFRGGTALLTLLAAMCVHAGANVVNDYHDRDADAGNSDRLSPFTGGSRMIQDGGMSARSMAVYGYALLVAAIVIGLMLAAGNLRLLLVGLAGLGLAVAYSAPPLRLSARGWGELGVAGAWLLVVVGADLVQRHAWSPQPFLVGLPVACLVAAILWVNEYPDHDADLRTGKRTIVVRMGRMVAAKAHLVLVALAHAWLLACCVVGALPPVAACGLLSAPLSLFAARRLFSVVAQRRGPGLLPVIKTTILAAHVHGVGLALGLLTDAIERTAGKY